MPKVSVIIPVYNVEPYLRECLDSVIHQTLRDMEIICIDDCSTDRSWDILQEYSAKDTRIVLLKNEKNAGQSVARNRGIEVATGEYIQFVDSDDYILADAMERLYTLAATHDLDYVRPLYRYSNQVQGSDFIYDQEIEGKVCTGEQLFLELEKDRTSRSATVLNFVKTECVRKNNIWFYPGICGEDILFTFDMYRCAQRCMCVNEVIYVCRGGRPNSITVSTAADKWLKSRTVLMEEIIKRLTSYPLDYSFHLAAMSYFCNIYNNRFLCITGTHLQTDVTKWNADTVNTYQMMYGPVMRYQNILRSLPGINEAKIFVYGAGVMGERLLRLLDLYDIPVAGVCVTDPSKGKKSLLGHPVQAVTDIPIDPERDCVLVAASKQNQNAMLNTLREKGIRNVISCPVYRL